MIYKCLDSICEKSVNCQTFRHYFATHLPQAAYDIFARLYLTASQGTNLRPVAEAGLLKELSGEVVLEETESKGQ